MKRLLAEYGRIALVIYVVLTALSWIGFLVAISSGIEIEAASGKAGTIAAAWVAAKVTQPIRIGVTILLTPLVARLLKRSPRPQQAGSEEPVAAAVADE